MTIIYFTFYCLLIIPIFTIFNKLNIKTVKNISSLSSIRPLFQISIALIFISLGGLPPLTGFIPKLSVLIILADKNIVIFILLIIGSLINLYFYLNIVINTIMIAPKNTKTSNMFYSPNINSAIIAVALLSLGVIPVIILIYAMTLLDKS
jgi:NADH:ubiquinone oxidoreductase subunit 2 (subunit N)